MMPRLRTLTTAVLITAVALTCSACSAGEPPMSERPPIADIVSDYDAVAAELQQLITESYPDATWVVDGDHSEFPGPGDGTTIVHSPLWYLPATLADDEGARDELVEAADVVVSAHGFDDFAVVEAKPGSFTYVTSDTWGGELEFGGGTTNVTISYVTGAHPDD